MLFKECNANNAYLSTSIATSLVEWLREIVNLFKEASTSSSVKQSWQHLLAGVAVTVVWGSKCVEWSTAPGAQAEAPRGVTSASSCPPWPLVANPQGVSQPPHCLDTLTFHCLSVSQPASLFKLQQIEGIFKEPHLVGRRSLSKCETRPCYMWRSHFPNNIRQRDMTEGRPYKHP